MLYVRTYLQPSIYSVYCETACYQCVCFFIFSSPLVCSDLPCALLSSHCKLSTSLSPSPSPSSSSSSSSLANRSKKSWPRAVWNCSVYDLRPPHPWLFYKFELAIKLDRSWSSLSAAVFSPSRFPLFTPAKSCFPVIVNMILCADLPAKWWWFFCWSF